MRKSLLFGAMLLVASCTVQKEKEFESQSQHRYHAVAEEPVDAETRVYADSKLRVRWNEGDHITIFERDTYNQEYEFLGDTGDTAGDFALVESGGYHTGGNIEDKLVYAIYPYHNRNKCDYDGKLTVEFPSTQHYKKDSFGVGANVMVAKTNTLDLRFMHVGGYRTFKLYGEGVFVSSVRLESNGPEYLSGRTDVVIGEDGKPAAAVSFIESTSNSKSVELVCDTPVALGATASEAVEFWFVLPPGTLAQGFTVTVTDVNGRQFTKSTSNSIEIKSGVKKSMPAFEVEMGSEPVISVPEAVDLGLPSGVKWASFNLGASAPEEYGDYYAWGETEPHYSSLDPLIWKNDQYNMLGGYSLPSYKWYNGTALIKYCTKEFYGYCDFMDGKAVLDSEDDAAQINLGGEWRMPTDAEWTELRENCTWAWATQDGVNGYQVVASNGNSVFLPAAGLYGTNLYNVGSNGYYWSSSLCTDGPLSAWIVSFHSGEVLRNGCGRESGLSIRPVYGDSPISVESISLNISEMEITVGESTQLTATILPENATFKTLTWSSNNNSVATVSSTGIVTGVAVGSATITVTSTDGNKTATCNVSVNEPPVPVPEAIDLGLPSGLKWASFNLKASKPEEFGDYYAWGETEMQDSFTDFSSYLWCNGTADSLTKYCYESSLGYNGFVDNKMTLDAEDDAAIVSLGSSWRMPTKDEFAELIENCSFSMVENYHNTGVNGIVFNGRNGNSIFFPAGGLKRDPSVVPYTHENELVAYWSSTLSIDDIDIGIGPKCAYALWFEARYSKPWINWPGRDCGLPIRPVYAE